MSPREMAATCLAHDRIRLITCLESIHMKINDVLWAAPFVCFFGSYLGLSLLLDSSVATPNVIGLPLDHAVAIISSAGLNSRIIKFSEEESANPGIILNQTPSSDHLVKKQQTIYLIVSQKALPQPTPLFLGKFYDQIQPQTQNLSTKIMSYWIPSRQPTGICIAQTPSAESPLTETASLILYFAQPESKKVLMPSFIGHQLSDALATLNAQGIDPEIFYESTYARESKKIKIIKKQRPQAGALIDLDSSITVQLSVE